MQQPPSGGTWVGSTCNILKLHDRSCLEMSEADGVDSGAICKRGFIHLQFAEKPEAPEAERCSNLHAVGPGSEVLVIYRKLIDCKYYRANGCVLEDFSKIFSIKFQLNWEVRAIYVHSFCRVGPLGWALGHANTGRIGRTLMPVSAGTDVVFSGANKSPTPVGPQTQQPPSGGTWVGSTCDRLKSIHDRSCLEMFEADGVDSGAICKRGFIHLQFAEKPEAPEAEKHLGSWILE
ncbi:hypothetical protein V1477_017438 [Vespula maculifrons]|uniref:Uncharacterized protein n=1 Tax=Vespula maculifrons TaxID=7453 RepID=A0ABD2B636_VESMC